MSFDIYQLVDFDFSYCLLIISTLILSITVVKIIYYQNLLVNTILLSIFSLYISICYMLMDAPDVAMTEVALGACLSTVILVSIVKIVDIVPPNHIITQNHNKNKILLSLGLSLIFITTLTYIGLELPSYGDVSTPIITGTSKYYVENTLSQIGIPSVVAAILASYRGFDTLGETSVILIAGLSVILILSKKDSNITKE